MLIVYPTVNVINSSDTCFNHPHMSDKKLYAFIYFTVELKAFLPIYNDVFYWFESVYFTRHLTALIC